MKDLLSLDKDTLKIVIESLQSFALWLTLALIVVLIIAAVVVKFKVPDRWRGFTRLAVGVAVGFSVALIALILFVQISRMAVKDELDAYFYTIVGLCAFVVAAVIACVLIKLFAPKLFKYFAWAFVALFAVYVIVILCVFPTVKVDDPEWPEDYTPLNKGLYIALSVILIAAIAVLAVLFDRKKTEANATRQLAYAGVCVATAFALSYVKFFSLPMGGSVTLVSMLPIMLYAYMFGAKRGVIVGIVYGLLQFIQSPQIYEPMQVLLDYPIAFGALGLAGIFRGMKGLKGNMFAEFLLGMLVACFGRYVSHVLSGYFVFYSWATETFEGREFLYSVAYNSFVFVDLLFDVVVGATLLASPSMRKQIAAVNPTETAPAAEAKTADGEAKTAGRESENDENKTE